MIPRFGFGVYTLTEAARYADVHPSTARTWFKGRSDQSGRGPVLKSDYDLVDDDFAVSFLDLVDLHVAGRFRKEGVRMLVVRQAYNELAKELRTKHPFAHSRLYTDGKSVIAAAADRVDDAVLYDVVSKQMFFPQLKDHLSRIDYSIQSYLAERWRIAEGVVLDPRRGFGKPVLANTGVSALVVARQYFANAGNAGLVADLFGIGESDVRNAVDFNKSFLHSTAA